MNLWMSLLLYNPLEAFVLLWACHSFNPATKDEKFDFVKNVKHFYILGAIFLPLQYVPFLFPENVLTLILSLICTFFGMPLILWLYLSICQMIKHKKFYSIKMCFVVFVPYLFSLIMLITFFNLSMFLSKDFYSELFFNILIKTIQLIILIILKRFYAKKISKKFCKK